MLRVLIADGEVAGGDIESIELGPGAHVVIVAKPTVLAHRDDGITIDREHFTARVTDPSD